MCTGQLVLHGFERGFVSVCTYRKGEEHGYFAFGGSTCLILFQPNTMQFDADLLENSVKPLETLVKVRWWAALT